MAEKAKPRSTKGPKGDRPELITGKARLDTPSVDLETASWTDKPKNVVKARPPQGTSPEEGRLTPPPPPLRLRLRG